MPGPSAYPGTAIPGATTYPGATVPLLTGSGTVTTVMTGASSLATPTKGVGYAVTVMTGTSTGTGFGNVSTSPNVSATPDPLNEPPRILVEVFNFGGATATVVRVNPDGSVEPVRTGTPATLVGGHWLGYDYEAHFNQPAIYRAIPAAGVTPTAPVDSSAVTLTVTQPWLIHPGIPSYSVPATVALLDDETKPSTAGVYEVLGRRTPIVNTDGMRKSARYNALIKTRTRFQYDALDDLLADTQTLLLQVVYPYTDEADYRWISVGDVGVARRPGTNYGDTTRVWTLPITDVNRPTGLLQAQRTYADLIIEAGTYAGLRALYATYRGVLTGVEGA